MQAIEPIYKKKPNKHRYIAWRGNYNKKTAYLYNIRALNVTLIASFL